MRRMEILRIRREHINSQQRTIFIPKAKGGSRLQPITQHLAEFLEGYLAALPQGSEWLFPSVAAKEDQLNINAFYSAGGLTALNTGSNGNGNVVSEPATMMLVFIGLGFLSVFVRREGVAACRARIYIKV